MPSLSPEGTDLARCETRMRTTATNKPRRGSPRAANGVETSAVDRRLLIQRIRQEFNLLRVKFPSNVCQNPRARVIHVMNDFHTEPEIVYHRPCPAAPHRDKSGIFSLGAKRRMIQQTSPHVNMQSPLSSFHPDTRNTPTQNASFVD